MMRIFIIACIGASLLGVPSLGVSATSKEYQRLEQELKEIKRLVSILEKRSRPAPKPKTFPKPTRRRFDNVVGMRADCVSGDTSNDTSDNQGGCQTDAIFKLSSKHGQELSFYGDSFESNGNIKQTIKIEENIKENYYINGFFNVGFNNPQTFGLGLNGWAGFAKNEYELELTISQHSYLVDSENGAQFYRNYDINTYWNFSKRQHFGARLFVRHSAFSGQKENSVYTGRFYLGWGYYLGKTFNYAVQIEPFYQYDYDVEKPVEDERPGDYVENYGVRASLAYHF